MNHFVLFLICIFSVEVFFRLNFLLLVGSILNITKRVLYVIPQDSISDHWKEKIIPIYACRIMKFSLQILLIFMLIVSFLIISNIYIFNFFELMFSFTGIIESIFFTSAYVFLRRIFIK